MAEKTDGGKNRLVLHIGLQKTGTSSIQVMLAGSGAYLRDQGYSFPQLPASLTNNTKLSKSPFRHNQIAASYADYSTAFSKLTDQELIEFWADIAADPCTPILSAEDFSRQKNFAALGQDIAQFDVEVVLYVRRQDLFAESLYNQRNKILLQRGITSHLGEDFLTEADLFSFLRREAYIPILNFSRLLSEIEKDIRPSKICVRAFDRSVLAKADVCADFCDQFGWNFDQMTKPPHDANGSIANIVLHTVKEAFLSGGPDAAKQEIDTINASIRGGDNLSGPYKVLSDTTRSKIQEQYREINADLLRRYNVDITSHSGP